MFLSDLCCLVGLVVVFFMFMVCHVFGVCDIGILLFLVCCCWCCRFVCLLSVFFVCPSFGGAFMCLLACVMLFMCVLFCCLFV